MVGYTLLTTPKNPHIEQVLVAAKYGNVELNVVDSVNTTSADFLAKNPTGKVPVLETPQGPVFDTGAIVRYIARVAPAANLLGKSFYESALVDQWIGFAHTELSPAVHVWILPIIGDMKYDAAAETSAKEDVKKAVQVLDTHFKSSTYLVGNSVTLADIVVASTMKPLFQNVLDTEFRSKHPYVTRWFVTLVNQPQFKNVVGEVKLAQKVATASAKAVKKADSRAEAPAQKTDAKKASTPKAAATPKAESTPVAASTPTNKKKNPLDELPPTNMNLDSVKRLFSNNKFDVAAKQFWAEFDAAGYCLYENNYQYNDENSVYFMTCNLVGGYMQRLESLRKYGFGALFISGPEDGPYDINGCWLFRGLTIPAEMSECSDSEYYTWKKLDHKTPEGRKRVEQLWDAEVVDGKKVHERRFFK